METDQFMNKSIRVINILKEPLLHFLLIGVVLFLLFDWKGTPATLPGGQALPEAKIVVTREAISQVVDQFRKTWQRPPSKEETDALVEDLVAEVAREHEEQLQDQRQQEDPYPAQPGD